MAIFTAGKPLTTEEQNQFYQGNVANKGLMDYVPNVFGGVPVGFEGLLGSEQTQQISQRSNIAGLLGAAAALAQGMGSQGPRRSALQNVLGALAAGYGTAGAATEASLKNYANVQQLAEAQRKQAALQKFAERYPQYAELARIDPGRAVELVMQMEKQRPIAEAYQNIPSAAPAAAPNLYSVSAGRAADGGIAGVPAPVTPSAVPITATDQAISQAAGVTTAPVPTEAGYEALQQVPKVNPQTQFFKDQISRLTVANSRLAAVGSKEANDEIKNNISLIDSLTKQLQQAETADIDLSGFKASLPEEFRGRVDELDKLAKKNVITGDQLRQGMQDISNKAAEYQQKLDDRTNDVRRTAAELYPTTPLHKLSQDQMKRLNAVLLQRDKEARRAGAATISVGDKVLAGERAKAQSRAEENAINAQSSASDVRAIVDILKPYRGGALQDFAGSIGAYLPGTELEQLATARQAAEAIRAKLAPTLRVEGSGATSDFEIKSFLAAIPSLFNTAQGRELMATYADKLANRAIAAADIRAQLVEEGRFTIKNFQQALANAGLNQVFTPEDLALIRGKKAPEGGVNLSTPEGQRAYERYKPR